MTRTFRAPGRVNLIGEHTDYNGGFVLPAALNLCCSVTAETRTDGRLTVRSREAGAKASWSLTELAAAKPRSDWSDYVAGVAVELLRLGVNPPATRLAIESAVPLGSGLSSSASLEVATALALASLAGVDLPKKELARACQRAENDFVGMKCGIMDQFVSVFGRADHAILIDCRSLNYQATPLPQGLKLVMVNTMVKHELAASEYNQRRRECEEAAASLGKPLRDVSAADWEKLEARLPDVPRRRARHVITENERVSRFVEAGQRGDRTSMGALMAESHRSLRDDYEVSCAELDFLAESAAALPGVVGARMTGGGFGGCTVNLVETGSVAGFEQAITAAYEKRFGVRPEVYVAQAADGAHEV